MATAYEHVKKMWDFNADIFSKAEEYLNEQQINDAYEMLRTCEGNVCTMGMGSSGIVARKAAHEMNVNGLPTFYLSAGDCAHGDMGSLKKGDVVIVISNGGETEEIVALLPSMKHKGVRLIAVTAKPESVIGKASDLVIRLNVPEADSNGLATTSFLVQCMTLDALADRLSMREGFNHEELYYNHVHGGKGHEWKAESGK